MSDSKTSMDPVNKKSKLTKERKALVHTTVRNFDYFMMYQNAKARNYVGKRYVSVNHKNEALQKNLFLNGKLVACS